MREATAWIIDLGHGLHAALGSSELAHLISDPTLFEMPQTPSYCRHLVMWEGAMVPVLDLAFWLLGEPAERAESFVAVVGYQEQPADAPQHGALLTAGIPDRVRVCDEQACDLAPRPFGWRHVACSCFMHNNEPIPILDLPFLFSREAGLGDLIEDVHRRIDGNGAQVSSHFATAQARRA